MKKLFGIVILFVIVMSIQAQTLDRLKERVDANGETVEKSYEFYATIEDALLATFKKYKWEDEITKMKRIIYTPPDPNLNRFYFLAVNTKNTSTPFYIQYYLYHPSTRGKYFWISEYPKEIEQIVKDYEEAAYEEFMRRRFGS